MGEAFVLVAFFLYSHSASIPISLHFRSRHSWHFLRMYMSISQFPPLLHLYTAFFVILLLKNPARKQYMCMDAFVETFLDETVDETPDCQMVH